MQASITLLRGINVSGQKNIRMAELKALYESLELKNIQTYLQSGNVVFNCEEKDTVKLKLSIEAQIERVFGFSVPVLIHTVDIFQRIIKKNPFKKQSDEDPARVMVTFLYEFPNLSKLVDLNIPDNETCEFTTGEQEIYLYCPDGYGKSKLSNTFFEKKLDVVATTRNWKTVNALYKMANEAQHR